MCSWRVSAPVVRYSPLVAAALEEGRPIVALETSVLAQGLPIPANGEAARRMTRAIEVRGAEPAIAAIAAGIPSLGLSDSELARFLARDGVRKVSARDLPAAVLDGADGATTVAATLALVALTPVQVFATGGIGGVHHEPAFDESADLPELANASVLVICAGAKSILDLPATMERLETLGVPVVGYGTDEMPGFFTARTGLKVPAVADSPDVIARLFCIHRSLGRRQAMLVVQPPPRESALSAEVVERVVARARAEAEREGVRGSGLTPHLLAEIERETGGESLAANVALLEANAALAAHVAAALQREGNGIVAATPRSV